jgi:hypothetical protein
MIREETAVWSGPTPAWRRLECLQGDRSETLMS